MMSFYQYSLLARKLTRQNTQALVTLAMAMLIAITVVSGLLSFIDSVDEMLKGESQRFQAADSVLVSSQPIPLQIKQQADQLGLTQAETIRFRTMLFFKDEMVLVSATAVSARYPLRGEVTLKYALKDVSKTITEGPQPGNIWLDQRILRQLNVAIGDAVMIGEYAFNVEAILLSEPDAGAAAFSFAPKIMFAVDDVDKTEVIQPGSRVTYRLLLRGQAELLEQFIQLVSPNLTEHQQFQDLQESQPRVASALNRAHLFFGVAISIVVLLAVIAIAMSSMRYARDQIKTVAILKTLGCDGNTILSGFLGVIGLLFVVVSLLGSFLGYGLQAFLTQAVATKMGIDTPELSASPWVIGLAIAFVSVIGFVVPPIARLKQIPAMTVLQLASVSTLSLTKLSLFIALISLLLLLYLINDHLLMSLLLIGIVLFLIIFITLPTFWLLTRKHYRSGSSQSFVKIAIGNLRRNAWLNSFQLSTLALCLTFFVLIIGIRSNLFLQWQNQLPEKTPNYFLLNIQQDELVTVRQLLPVDTALSDADSTQNQVVIYPMIRGRLIEINDKPLQQSATKSEQDRAGVNRELNLSFTSQLPRANKIIAGHWFDKQSQSAVSVEAKLAERLGIQLNDELTFSMGAESLKVKVTSLREVDWDTMQPNFFMLFQQETLAPFNKTYMTSFYLAKADEHKLDRLLAALPTLVLIDLDATIQQIREIIEQVSAVLNIVLIFVFIGTLLVLVASVQTSLNLRHKENTILRALGASSFIITGSVTAEFSILGGGAGLLATMLTEISLQFTQVFIFDLPVSLHPSLWWIAPITGFCAVTTLGVISTRGVIKTQPDQLLRQID